jgi:hypothetical protein
MLLYFIITIIIGVLVGSMIEKYRWVNLAKKNKLKEVDGDLYKVIKVKPKIR